MIWVNSGLQILLVVNLNFFHLAVTFIVVLNVCSGSCMFVQHRYVSECGTWLFLEMNSPVFDPKFSV